MSVLHRFNKQLLDFLTELKEIFPEIKKINYYINSIELILKINPKKIPQNFGKNVYQYKNKIFNEDIAFFLESNEFKNDMELKGSNIFSEVIFYKDIWKNELSDTTKKAIWRYLKILIKLYEKISF